MAEKTNISWSDATWNPIRGCSRVSPGCVNCYAEELTARWSGSWGAGFAETTAAGARWTRKVELLPHMLDRPLKWKRPRRIFVNSLSDLFHESLSNEATAAVFGVMAACPQHTFQVLTKRAERMREWFGWANADCCQQLAEVALGVHRDSGHRFYKPLNASWLRQEWPLPNVWLGVSAEDQERADERIPALLRCPAKVRFVSYEPALGPVDFAVARSKTPPQVPHVDPWPPLLHWIIAGGESGPNRRPCEVAWFESAARQCQEAGVAFFMKQDGAFKPGQQGRIPDELWARKEFPS